MNSGIVVTGWGATSPAGWGVPLLRDVCDRGQTCASVALDHVGSPLPIYARKVPAPPERPSFLAHPRLRRSSSISIYSTAAALEAIGTRLPTIQSGERRLGILFTSMTGCVSYSRRFFDEALRDPVTASPILFPETVFNAPASHLATYLKSHGPSYTMIGDAGSFLQGLALAAEWLLDSRVDLCLVIGAEELDWLVADAQRLFDSEVVVGEGAGALLLERGGAEGTRIEMDFVSQPVLYTAGNSRADAICRAHKSIRDVAPYEMLFDSLTGASRLDAAELGATAAWTAPRVSVKTLCGESFAAGSAWQCVMAVDHLARGMCNRAAVFVAGCNEQAIAAGFSRPGLQA